MIDRLVNHGKLTACAQASLIPLRTWQGQRAPRQRAAIVIVLLAAVSTLSGIVPAEDLHGPPRPIDLGGWAADPLWDDGNAEVARYEATEIIYGETRHHTAVLITVKEDFNTAHQVKADWPYGEKKVVEMLKTNLVEEVPTPNYPYRSMTSTFVRREAPHRGHKVSYLLHEWCGNTYKELRHYEEPQGARLVYHTYWDGTGSGERPLSDAMLKAIPEEQLFLLVRAIELTPGVRYEFDLLPTLRGSRLGASAPAKATLHIGLAFAAKGDSLPSFPVRIVCDDGRELTFRVANNTERTILFADFGDGRTYKLIDTERRQYWVRPE